MVVHLCGNRVLPLQSFSILPCMIIISFGNK
jgi:hypothetical protein